MEGESFEPVLVCLTVDVTCILLKMKTFMLVEHSYEYNFILY